MTTLNEKLNALSPERRASVQAHTDELKKTLTARETRMHENKSEPDVYFHTATDPAAQTLTKLTVQRDEYRMHMERYQGEVAELKAENAAIVKAFRNMALDSVRLQSELDFSKALLEQSEDHPDEPDIKTILDSDSELALQRVGDEYVIGRLDLSSWGDSVVLMHIASGSTLAKLVENYTDDGH